MTSVNANANSILIVVKFDTVTFTSTDITNFDLISSLNGVPGGQFLVNDKNSDFIKQKSGDYGIMAFNDINADGNQQLGAIPFIIDEFTEESKSDNNTVYRIKWTAGVNTALNKKNGYFKGTSFDALLDIAKKYGVKMVELVSTTNFDKPSDSMTWRYIQSNMWEALSTVVNNSYLKNDYLFWTYDETHDYLRLSTLGFEKARQDTNLFVYSTNAYTSGDESKVKIKKPELTIWAYASMVRSEEVGKSREHLFPNVSFSGVVDTELKQAKFNKNCFADVVNSMGDDKQNEIIAGTGMDDKTNTYGNLQVKRHYPNNGHKMYSIADTYRKYKLHTYNKILYITIYNSLGPAVGTKCSVLVNGNNIKIRGYNVDTTYTDSYIIDSKFVTYTTNVVKTTGRTVSTGTALFSTTLRLISDNFGDSGYKAVLDLIDQMGTK